MNLFVPRSDDRDLMAIQVKVEIFSKYDLDKGPRAKSYSICLGPYISDNNISGIL